jgi:starvation-inducible outer membrane lipoprotein
MMRTTALFAAVACLALAACAQTPPPAIQTKVVTVYEPIAVRCIDPARVPALVPHAQLTGDAVHDSAELARVDLGLRSWVDQVSTLIMPCVVDPPK